MQNTAKQNYPGSVASYGTQSAREMGNSAQAQMMTKDKLRSRSCSNQLRADRLTVKVYVFTVIDRSVVNMCTYTDVVFQYVRNAARDVLKRLGSQIYNLKVTQ